MTDNALAVVNSKLSAQEQQLVNAFITDQALDPRSVAKTLDLSVENVLDVMKREHVRRAIGLGLLTEKKERFKDVRDGVVLALWQLATYDVADLFDKEGKQLNLRDIPRELRAAIKGYKMGKYGPEFTFVDRVAIMQTLLSFFDKVEKRDGGPTEEKTVVHFHETDPDE